MERRQGTQDESGQTRAVVERVGLALQDSGSEHGQGLGLGRERREHRQCVGQQVPGPVPWSHRPGRRLGTTRSSRRAQAGHVRWRGRPARSTARHAAFFLAAPFARPVLERADEFGDGFAHCTAAQLGDGLFQTDQVDRGAGVRQTVQAEEVGEGLALDFVERAETHPCDGAAGGEAVVDRVPERAEFGAAQVCSPGAGSVGVIPPPGRCRSR